MLGLPDPADPQLPPAAIEESCHIWQRAASCASTTPRPLAHETERAMAWAECCLCDSAGGRGAATPRSRLLSWRARGDLPPDMEPE